MSISHASFFCGRLPETLKQRQVRSGKNSPRQNILRCPKEQHTRPRRRSQSRIDSKIPQATGQTGKVPRGNRIFNVSRPLGESLVGRCPGKDSASDPFGPCYGVPLLERSMTDQCEDMKPNARWFWDLRPEAKQCEFFGTANIFPPKRCTGAGLQHQVRSP